MRWLFHMTRLSQQALTDALQAIQQAGGRVDRDTDLLEEALIATRNRVRAAPRTDTLLEQRAGMVRCLQPLFHWLNGEQDLRDLEAETRSDLIWNLYATSVARTQGSDAFPLVVDNIENWTSVLREMPNQEVAAQQVTVTTQMRTVQWHWRVLTVGLALLALDSWISSDRWRVYTTLLGGVLVGLGGLLWYFNGDEDRPVPVATSRRVIQDAGLGHGTSVPSRGVAEQRIPESSDPVAPQPEVPPIGAPPLPVTSISTITAASGGAIQAQMFAISARVRMLNVSPYGAVAGQVGTVQASESGKVTVQLDSGMVLQHVPSAVLMLDGGVEGTVGGQIEVGQGQSFYAPFAVGGPPTRVQAQASRIKDALVKAHSLASSMPTWGSMFWQAVKNEKDLYGLEATLLPLLQAHGYIGDATVGPPREDELRKALQEYETMGGPSHGTGGAFARVADIAVGDSPEQLAWHLKLPPDMQRAGPELYRNIRAEGAASVRQWISDQHPSLEARQTPAFQDLFTAASIIDFELAECKSELAIMQKLGTSDTLEIQLRKLGAFIYYRRTKDKTGANRMLGIRTPGSGADIAPKWMLDDANTHSKVEYQRTERGHKMNRFDGGSGSGQTRYAGKFRGRGGRGKGGGGKGQGSSNAAKTQG